MSEILREPLELAAAWLGAEQGGREDWAYRLEGSEIAELDAAVAHARATAKPLAEIGADDFPLVALGEAISRWMTELQDGRGFVLVRGIPVDRYSEEEVGLAYWGLGLHMGTAVSQNAAGDVLGHVRDTGADPADPSVRLYKTRVDLGFHCDGSDIVGLLCLKPARAGGTSRIVSSVSVYNEVLRRRPDLVDVLYEPFHWDRNEEQGAGEPPYFSLPICHYEEGRLRTFYIGWYIRGAQRHADVPRLTREQHDLIDLIDEIAADPVFHLDMDFEPGDIQWLKNSVVLHARTDYEDFDEPERKRHLLRLWLTAHGRWADGDRFLQQGIPAKDGVVPDAEANASPGAAPR
jgi:hypothetical protein